MRIKNHSENNEPIYNNLIIIRLGNKKIDTFPPTLFDISENISMFLFYYLIYIYYSINSFFIQ